SALARQYLEGDDDPRRRLRHRRTIVYLLRVGYEVFGADRDPKAIDAVRRLAPRLPADNFRVESVEAHSFRDRFADLVIINPSCTSREMTITSTRCCTAARGRSNREAFLQLARVHDRGRTSRPASVRSPVRD